MSNENQTELFTNKHLRLMNIAKLARIFSWIFLIVYVLLAGLKADVFIQYVIFNIRVNEVRTVTNDLLGQAFTIINLLFDGFLYFIILTAVSYGLNMLVETDVNYRIKQNSSGATNV